MIPSRVTRVCVNTQTPWMLMQSILSRLAKEKGHRVRVMGVSSAVEHILNETAMQARTLASNRLARANRASHGPRVRAKVRVKRTRENAKESPKDPKVPKARTRAKHRKLVSQVLKTRNQRQARKLGNLHRHVPLTLPGTMVGIVANGMMAGVDAWNDDWSSVGWHEGWEQTNDTSASSFSRGGLDLGATSSPKRFEWVKMNLDTGAALNTFPLNFGPEGAGDGRFYRTASGEWIPDGGAWQFQGYDENGLPRSLNGRLTEAYEVLGSAASASAPAPTSGAAGIACKEQQDFYVEHNGGDMIPTHSKIRIHFENLLNECGKNDIIPVHLENDTPNFYLNREVKSEETHSASDAEQGFEKKSQQSGNEYGRAVRL